MNKDDIADIRRKMDDLQMLLTPWRRSSIKRLLNRKLASSQAISSNETTQDENVVDADYRVVDDDNK